MDYNDIDIFSKRFAKLIIQDFIDICNAEKNNYSKDRQASYDWEDKNIYAEGEAACASIKHQVKQRFEVEE